MFRIDRAGARLEPLTLKTLAHANILERDHLQKMIVRNPDAFFSALGEELLLINQEVRPSELVNDRIDLLAIDSEGATVIIELKRAEQKLQLFQALSYAAMLSEWDADRLLAERENFTHETPEDAKEKFAEHLADFVGDGISELNRSQRVILIAERFDYALLRTAEWLTERYNIRIHCYRWSYACDGSSEYLTCSRVYPPLEIVDQSSRARQLKAGGSTQKFQTWDEALANIQSPIVRAFYEDAQAKKLEMRRGGRQVIFRIRNQVRFGVCARRKHTWVWQRGRFPGDQEFWRAGLSELGGVRVGKNSNLNFTLHTAEDFKFFLRAVETRLQSVEFTDTASLANADEDLLDDETADDAPEMAPAA